MALQAIRKIFFRAAPTTAQDRLVARLRELIETCLHADVVVDATMRALAATFVAALSAVDVNASAVLARRVRAIARPGVVALLASKCRPYRCASRRNGRGASCGANNPDVALSALAKKHATIASRPKQGGPFVEHVGLLAEDEELQVGELCRVLHCGPPLHVAASGTMPAHLWRELDLTKIEIEESRRGLRTSRSKRSRATSTSTMFWSRPRVANMTPRHSDRCIGALAAPASYGSLRDGWDQPCLARTHQC